MDLDYLNYNQQMNNNYSTDGNTLESFVSPYLTQKASTSIQQYQLPSSHQEHSLQLNNPSTSNINFQTTNIKTHIDVKEFLNKICQYFKNLKFKENQKRLEKLLFDTKQNECHTIGGLFRRVSMY
uniref:Uncharacterized protein n=1 Tax=Meloidogyne incognita TaxID=6306 RepID=A0A914MM55_MELIC